MLILFFCMRHPQQGIGDENQKHDPKQGVPPACSAGKDVTDLYVGAQMSIAQLIANQTGRGVYAYKVGMYFSQQDRDNDQHYDGSTSPNPPASLPMYMVPVGPPGHKPALTAFPAH
jgi:hypothetical protein